MYFRTGSHKSRGNRNIFLKPALIAAKAKHGEAEAVTGSLQRQRKGDRGGKFFALRVKSERTIREKAMLTLTTLCERPATRSYEPSMTIASSIVKLSRSCRVIPSSVLRSTLHFTSVHPLGP